MIIFIAFWALLLIGFFGEKLELRGLCVFIGIWLASLLAMRIVGFSYAWVMVLTTLLDIILILMVVGFDAKTFRYPEPRRRPPFK